jgi:predicted nucleic acid-binding protein
VRIAVDLTDAQPVWVVDASVWTAYFMDDDVYNVASRTWVTARLQLGDELAGPDLLLVEVAAAIARRSGRAAPTEAAVANLLASPQVRFVPTDEAQRDAAAQLAVNLRLRGADAVYVAVAQQLGVPLITWDQEQLTRAAPAVTVRTP